jgi:hypothetical protein
MPGLRREDEITDICRSAKDQPAPERVVDVSDPILSTGIQSGGFFFVCASSRHDVIERIYAPQHACSAGRHNIRHDEQLRASATRWSGGCSRSPTRRCGDETCLKFPGDLCRSVAG